MKDVQGNLVLGRTRWWRFAAVLGPAAVAAGAIVFGMANGAIAASFTISGEEFKVSADELRGSDFRQYGSTDTTGDGEVIPVARSVIGSAELDNLCQSVSAPNPFGWEIVLRIEAGGGGTPATADNLQIGLQRLEGNATFTNIQIGRDAGDLGGQAGMFGQSAEAVVIEDLRQTAVSTSAGTFRLNGLTMAVLLNEGGECF